MTTSAEPFSGGGRRDKTPADSSIIQQAEAALRNSSHAGLRHVHTRFDDGHITLTGQVASYYLKQLAQTIVGQLPQVASVDNQLQVQGP